MSRKNDMNDDNYRHVFKSSSLFEFVGLSFLLFSHLPLLLYFPYAYFTLVFSAVSYYFLHRKSHLDVAWGKKWLPWHAEHHMGKNQHLNWGVRLPIFDMLLGTHKIDLEGVQNE
jgi:sterol desaturase/sphingolipid hydroxylase (fatty acid hydroxylase superfamily)